MARQSKRQISIDSFTDRETIRSKLILSKQDATAMLEYWDMSPCTHNMQLQRLGDCGYALGYTPHEGAGTWASFPIVNKRQAVPKLKNAPSCGQRP